MRDGQRAPARTFQDLIVWQKAHRFVLEVYRLTDRFPKTEVYGLTSQFRRAAVSVPANIAEGFKKRGQADKARFMNTGQGSLEEALLPDSREGPRLRRHGIAPGIPG